MGFSSRAAVLTALPYVKHVRIYSRSLVYSLDTQGKDPKSILAFEPVLCGIIINSKLFDDCLKDFYNKVNLKYSDDRVIAVQIPFAVDKGEEYFVDNIYRKGQRKLYERLREKSIKAINKINEENILICTSGISDHVILYK